jgi:hypothetical protein
MHPFIPGWRAPPSRAALDASSYVGPGDIVGSATSFWGMRAYNAAYATGSNPCMDVVDGSSATHTINILSTGFVDVATLSGLTGPLTVSKWYDHVGTNHLTPNGGNIPLTLSALNGLPCIDASATTIQGLQSGNVTISQPFTISWVGRRTANTTSFVEGLGAVGQNVAVGWNNAANQALTFAGTVLASPGTGPGSAPDSAFHAFQSVFNSTSSDICVDGTSNTGDAGATGFSAAPFRISRQDLAGGKYMEFGIWASAFNGTQEGNMNSNQHGTSGYNF